ncbi:MAG TPA: hypothetical protein VGJ28_20645, partial [Micromonosporaceae bacterium]
MSLAPIAGVPGAAATVRWSVMVPPVDAQSNRIGFGSVDDPGGVRVRACGSDRVGRWLDRRSGGDHGDGADRDGQYSGHGAGQRL